ncbi:Protein InaA [Methylophilaceae bacterium]|nr:Protein InaA [Methylophilaceae bacterium]
MCEIEYVSERWRDLLHCNHVDSFEALWQLEQDNWFEAPNRRRGGWSGVCRTTLALPGEGEVGVFIKRQENHVYHGWRHLFRPMATFEREYHNILAFQKYGIPTVDLIYFGQRKVGGKLRAILVTRELTGYQALDAYAGSFPASMDSLTRKKLFESMATAMRAMHARHFQHNCLYPKHLFIRNAEDHPVETRFIDLEKAKRWPLKRNVALKDLGTLHRHTEHCSKTDRLRFFLAYRQEKRLSDRSRKMLAAIMQGKKSHRDGNGKPSDSGELISRLQDAS